MACAATRAATATPGGKATYGGVPEAQFKTTHMNRLYTVGELFVYLELVDEDFLERMTPAERRREYDEKIRQISTRQRNIMLSPWWKPKPAPDPFPLTYPMPYWQMCHLDLGEFAAANQGWIPHRLYMDVVYTEAADYLFDLSTLDEDDWLEELVNHRARWQREEEIRLEELAIEEAARAKEEALAEKEREKAREKEKEKEEENKKEGDKQSGSAFSNSSRAQRSSNRSQLSSKRSQLSSERGQLLSERSRLSSEQGQFLYERGQLFSERGQSLSERSQSLSERSQLLSEWE